MIKKNSHAVELSHFALGGVSSLGPRAGSKFKFSPILPESPMEPKYTSSSAEPQPSSDFSSFSQRRIFLSFLGLAAVWIASHALPISNLEMWSNWELWQAKKLLEYGPLVRMGALLEPAFETGHLAFPSAVNYTHHPYLMVWMYTVLYAVGGAWTCFAYLLSLRLIATLVLYYVLLRYFSPKASWWAAVFYAVAPAALVMDIETNIIGIAAAYWPIAILVALRVRDTGRGAFLLGLIVFIGAQTSWMFLTLMAALIWISAPLGTCWPELFRRPLALPSSKAVLIGGGFALAIFLLQMFYYTPEWNEVTHYLKSQMGLARLGPNEQTPKSRMMLSVLFRNAFFIGPALGLGAIIGATVRIPDSAKRIVSASVLFIVGYAFVEASLVRFCFVEVSPYLYLLTPATILTAAALDRFPSKYFLLSLVALACLATLFFTMRDSIPKRSPVAEQLARIFVRNTQAKNIVLTNLRTNFPPFADWDTHAEQLVRHDSDRLIFFNVGDVSSIATCKSRLRSNFRDLVFAVSPQDPIDQALLARIQREGQFYDQQSFSSAPQPVSIWILLRRAIWKFTGRTPNEKASESSGPYETTLDFYRVSL